MKTLLIALVLLLTPLTAQASSFQGYTDSGASSLHRIMIGETNCKGMGIGSFCFGWETGLESTARTSLLYGAKTGKYLTGQSNILMGNFVFDAPNAYGDQVNAIGNSALGRATFAQNSDLMGNGVAKSAYTVNRTVAIGLNAVGEADEVHRSVYVGEKAGESSYGTLTEVTAVGNEAAVGNTGNQTLCLGAYSCYMNTQNGFFALGVTRGDHLLEGQMTGAKYLHVRGDLIVDNEIVLDGVRIVVVDEELYMCLPSGVCKRILTE